MIMAKFHNYYVLCPLIDQKSFLGVSKDKEDSFVIVTLGRNVASRYRLSDEKEVGGWTSRDHITSPVIYDKVQDSYVAVFNNNIIKIWKEDTQNLDKVKKFKFPIHMLQLIPRENDPIIIFNNGNCASLPYALENRKTYESKSLIKVNETIVDTACYTVNGVDHVCYVIKTVKDTYEVLNCPIREELGDLERSKLFKVQVKRPDDVYVVGTLICTQENVLAVYFLWSDSKLTMYDLSKKSWKTIGTVPWISTLTSVSMAWIGKNHIILFGSNPDQDGAIIVAYNIVLGIGSCKYPMKMYSDGAKLYCFYNRIVLEASNHIAIIPYTLETKRNLSNLLGSHEISNEETIEFAQWEPSVVPFIDDDLKEQAKLGLPERTICLQMVQPLLEKKNTEKLQQLLYKFKDIPEPVLVQLLNYSMNIIKSAGDINNNEEFRNFCNTNHEKFELTNFVFSKSFSDAVLIPQLRNNLPLDSVLFFMRYICYLLNDSDIDIDCDFETKLLDWCTLFMDAFYPQFLLTKDENVTNVLQKTLDTVNNLIKCQYTVDRMMKQLNKFINSKSNVNEESLPYSIEIMTI